MGKVYREFSRQKYNKYKHQFPKMRESEIVTKIIKEWDALGTTAKGHLQKIYEKNKVLTLEDISSSEQIMKSELLKKAEIRKSATQAKQSSSQRQAPTKIFPEPSGSKPLSDSDFNRDSNQRDDSKGVESSSPKLLVKTKKIAKTDYIAFYKQRYERLHTEHPRWTSRQISSIIKLQWKKEKKQHTKLRTVDERTGLRRKSKRIISGYQYFKRYRGYDTKECVYKWLHFPFETKTLWKRVAAGKKNAGQKNESLKLRSVVEGEAGFGFLKNKLVA